MNSTALVQSFQPADMVGMHMADQHRIEMTDAHPQCLLAKIARRVDKYLLVTMLDSVGVPIGKLGDSTGRLELLSGV